MALREIDRLTVETVQKDKKNRYRYSKMQNGRKKLEVHITRTLHQGFETKDTKIFIDGVAKQLLTIWSSAYKFGGKYSEKAWRQLVNFAEKHFECV